MKFKQMLPVFLMASAVPIQGHAVQTKDCPRGFAMRLVNLHVLSASELIRSNGGSDQEAEILRQMLEKTPGFSIQAKLTSAGAGRCNYTAMIANAPGEVVLTTSAGHDWMRFRVKALDGAYTGIFLGGYVTIANYNSSNLVPAGQASLFRDDTNHPGFGAIKLATARVTTR